MHKLFSLHIEQQLIEIRSQKVRIDRDVALWYAAAAKGINEAVKNETDKFNGH